MSLARIRYIYKQFVYLSINLYSIVLRDCLDRVQYSLFLKLDIGCCTIPILSMLIIQLGLGSPTTLIRVTLTITERGSAMTYMNSYR